LISPGLIYLDKEFIQRYYNFFIVMTWKIQVTNSVRKYLSLSKINHQWWKWRALAKSLKYESGLNPEVTHYNVYASTNSQMFQLYLGDDLASARHFHHWWLIFESDKYFRTEFVTWIFKKSHKNVCNNPFFFICWLKLISHW
jgi:hypothetical protein